MRGQSVMFLFSLFTGRICQKGSSAGIVFTHGTIFGVFAPIKAKFDREERHPHSSSDQGGADRGAWVYGPQNF